MQPVSSQSQESRRLALGLIAKKRGGCTLTLMQERGFALSVVYGLVRDGLVNTRTERLGGPHFPLEVIRLSLTHAGRKHSESPVRSTGGP